MRDLPAIHPGEQLREEFMKPLGLTAAGQGHRRNGNANTGDHRRAA